MCMQIFARYANESRRRFVNVYKCMFEGNVIYIAFCLNLTLDKYIDCLLSH